MVAIDDNPKMATYLPVYPIAIRNVYFGMRFPIG